MKVLQLGASGKTGKLICRMLLDREHHVNALVRNPVEFSIEHDALTIHAGTPQNKEDIRRALDGCDAVVSTLNVSMASGFPWSKVVSPRDLMSSSVANLVEAMREADIKRIIVMSSNGANESMRFVPWIYRALVSISNLKAIFDDHSRQEDVLLTSGLDWTALRPVGLNDKVVTPKVTVSFNGSPKANTFISRETVARYIVKVLEERLHVGGRPTIS